MTLRKLTFTKTTFYLALPKSNFCLLTSFKLLKALLKFLASHLQIMEPAIYCLKAGISRPCL